MINAEGRATRKQQTSTGRSVLPLRGGEYFAPSSVLVRAQLSVSAGEAARERAALALVHEIAYSLRTSCSPDAESPSARWWDEGKRLDLSRLSLESGIPLHEAETALFDLEEAEVVRREGERWSLSADVLCELPRLAELDVRAARALLSREKGSRGAGVMASIAVLRELARLAGDEHEVLTTVEKLGKESLYGKTRVSQSLALLESAGLLERKAGPPRTLFFALKVSGGGRGLSRAGKVSESRHQSSSYEREGQSAPLASGESTVLRFGSVRLRLPADAEVVLSVDDEGREWLRVGRNLELGPLE